MLIAGAMGIVAGQAQTTNGPTAIQRLQQIKTVFVIPLENHDLTQPIPDAIPQQLLGNPAAPYLNSLITPGHSNAVQVSYATRYYNVGHSVHPSEPNYIWAEAATDFGIYTDNDPASNAGNLFTAQHLTGQLTAAGIPWKSYQEDLEYAASPGDSCAGAGLVNPYNGSTEYYYAAKHNPMQFFTDTRNQNVFPLTNFWADLTNNALGRYNWITPNMFNEMHNGLPNGFTYHGFRYTGDQGAIAEGDNCLSIIIPKIMASPAYQDHGVIIIWMDETESSDDTRTTLPEIIISPLAKGNAYASSVEMNHVSDLKTMDEIFGLDFQTNAIPFRDVNASGTGYNTVATVNDLSDLFQGVGTANGVLPVQPPDVATPFQWTFSGQRGQPYQVLASDDLTVPVSAWTVVGSGTFVSTNLVFTDTSSTNYHQRFYRLQSP